MNDALGRIHVATIIHLVVVVILGAYLLIHGSLPDDALQFGAIAEGGNGLVAIGRGLNRRAPKS